LPGTTDGMGNKASFNWPVASILLNDSHILISDFHNNRLRLIKYVAPTKEVKQSKTATVRPKESGNVTPKSKPTSKATTNSKTSKSKISSASTGIVNKIATIKDTTNSNRPKSTISSASTGLPGKYIGNNELKEPLTLTTKATHSPKSTISSGDIVKPEKPEIKKPSNSNSLPEASIYFSRLKTINGIAVTALVGLGFTETYWLITLLISESKKFKSAMFQIASTATILHSMNLAFYYMVLDYQISPYLIGEQQLGAWALLCGVMGNLINILIYWFITVRLYMFMRVI
jgi:hypothetical protein